MEIKTNEEDDESVEDLITLSGLSEESILKTLGKRFSDGNMYSYIGSILLAFNPYKMLNIYGKDNVKKYEGQPIGELPPHLFAISNACYSRMCRDQQDQVVLISGESGSGKTESTKLIMQYLAATNRNGNNDIPDQILEGNPLLESFGNAKTIRNDNSSRFGKYIELHFQRGVLKGARTSQYLLEKSRIVKQSKDERNYHIFYEMLSMKKQERSKYGLQTASKYFYLNQGESCTIPGRVDADNYQLLTRSLNVLGFTEDEQDTINRILASVLHIGNIYFTVDSDSDVVKLGSDAEIKWISHLLKLSSDWLKTDLTTRVMEAREEKLFTPLSMEQAQDARDAIAKALYGCLFAWLVERLNQIVYRPAREKVTTMGLLDIFGFEEVELNSFEQLCINYANEMLHCFFNECVFQQEQLEYKKDRIEWQHIEFPDNEEVIQLISCKPHGILHILDDECNFPQATDKSFLDKCHYRYESSSLYEKPRMPAMEFSVYHYAGKVTYNVKTFLEKNKDTLRSDVIELLCQSKDVTISRMFEEMKNKLFVRTLSKTTGRYLTKKLRAQTVAAQFNESLMSLIDNMKRCNPFFIRCIKPNIHKSPMLFDKEIVLDQLRYSGVLQLIKIRQKGYPVRIKFPIFIKRYQCLLKEIVKEYQMPNEVCTKILATVCPASELLYQVGASKVFLRENFERRLDKAAKKVQEKASLLIQKYVRAFLKQKQFQKTLKSVKTIQNCIRARKIQYACDGRGWRMKAQWQLKVFVENIKKYKNYSHQRWSRFSLKEFIMAPYLVMDCCHSNSKEN